MPAVSITEAARALGFKSRSTLYRLIGDGYLADYLRPDGPAGRQSLELMPRGLPTLRDRVAQLIRPQLTNGFGERHRPPRMDPRWEAVAAELTTALEGIGGPSLTAQEAELLAAQIGPATWEAFPEGLPGGIPRKPPHPLGDGTTIMDVLWDPLARDANYWMVADGWRFPRLTGEEVLLVYRSAMEWMEETEWDHESVAYWKMNMGDTTPGDPCPDIWKCQWCGKPWHENHPEYARPPEVEAFWKLELARIEASIETSKNIPADALPVAVS
jgi:hypothetical protein